MSTPDLDLDTYGHRQCAVTAWHRAHLVQVAHWGVPEPDSVTAKVAALESGQRVRVVFEGIVNPPTDYPVDACRRPAVSIGAGDGHVVLRYTGAHPATEKEDGAMVAGKIVPTLVDVQVVT